MNIVQLPVTQKINFKNIIVVLVDGGCLTKIMKVFRFPGMISASPFLTFLQASANIRMKKIIIMENSNFTDQMEIGIRLSSCKV